MGTNYYFRTNICNCCDRYDEKHIGKSSAGWQFSFQGYSASNGDDVEITSWEDWKSFILDNTGGIFDEYGKFYYFHEFIKLVEDKQKGTFNNEPNKNHYDYLKEEGRYSLDKDWKDEEGYSFTSSEFS